MSNCKHMNFKALVKVARLEDVGKFMAEVTVQCADCDLPFQFLGLEPGLKLNGATVSLDGLEANLAIAPQGSTQTPFQDMVHGKGSLS